MNKAVCALIQTRYGDCLSVSRKYNHALLGLPGGKVEEGEDPLVALIRELKEETGKTFNPNYFELIFEALCKGDVDYYTYTYKYKAIVNFEAAYINTEKALVTFVPLDILCGSLHSPFYVYNRQLRDSLK